MKTILPLRGDYRSPLSCRKTAVIYEMTHRFYAPFLKKGDRTADQMVHAARSGKQNIVEGMRSPPIVFTPMFLLSPITPIFSSLLGL